MARRYSVKSNYMIVAKKANNNLDYYLKTPTGEILYLFTRAYSTACYDLCRGGAPINNVLYAKKHNEALMKLSKYLNFMMPYFIDYYELETA